MIHPGHLVRRIYNTHDENITDFTASFYELEPFDSIVHALQWRQIKRRLPMCMKKSLCNRFILPNFIYISYAIILLIIDFNEKFSPPPKNISNERCRNISNIIKTRIFILNQPIQHVPFVNELYIGKL